MICDNCGAETNHTRSNEFTAMRFRLGWPPVYRVIKQEMWCRRCDMAGHPASNSVSAHLRRKLDFDRNHPDHNETEP